VQFDQSTGPTGHLFLGDPETVARKIVEHQRIFRNDRFLLQMAIGPMPHEAVLRGIELYGTKVAPLVREMLANDVKDDVAASA
jgi:alkanesulfonate monooxygenase SsuD/methylene tetrahydromethanopterin reductase-like flavin-dependent oxidoreductase (luciferase family)